jgi:cation diffusion facilitator family transporter
VARIAPQQRTALLSVLAAATLVAVKLIVGLLSHSLALVAEAIHSGTDLVAAVLTFFALGVAVRPADGSHPFGHGKAEHLSALGEGAVLVVASLVIAYESIHRLASGQSGVDAHAYTLAVVGGVILVDALRATASRRAARRYSSPALSANFLHFGLDMLGSIAVLVGLVLVRAGYQGADSVAALLVAALVLFSAGRLMRGNVEVLMDHSPGGAARIAREAIQAVDPSVTLRRLRMREAGGRHFADVVVGVEGDAGLARGHAVASAIEDAIELQLPGSDVVVHVEPDAALGPLRQRATAAALTVPHVREIHNVTALRVGDGTELALHLKVPGELPLEAAHDIASEVERAIRAAVPEVVRVQSHIEPLAGESSGRAVAAADLAAERDAVRAIVSELTGAPPRELRFRETDSGLIAFLTLGMPPDTTLESAHGRASEIEQRLRAEHPRIVDVVIHTEPQ